MPGKVMNHQACLKMDVASAIMAPQLGVLGSMPTPRNERAASYRMFCGIRIVE